MHEQAELAIMI